MTEMDLDFVMKFYKTGDEVSWDDEIRWLWLNHTNKMARILVSIAKEGIHKPILLGDDGRVWDGHHRIAAARALGLKRIPVVKNKS